MPQHLLPLTACSLSMRPGQQAAERDRRRGWRWREEERDGREKRQERGWREKLTREGTRLQQGCESERAWRGQTEETKCHYEPIRRWTSPLPCDETRLEFPDRCSVPVRVQYQHDGGQTEPNSHTSFKAMKLLSFLWFVLSVTEYEEAAERRLCVIFGPVVWGSYHVIVNLWFWTEEQLVVCKTFPAHT